MSKVTYTTADGQKFVTENYAKLHAASLSNKSVTKSGGNTQPKLLTKADQIIAFATESTDQDALVVYLEAETSLKKPRVSVIDAIEGRLTELNVD